MRSSREANGGWKGSITGVTLALLRQPCKYLPKGTPTGWRGNQNPIGSRGAKTGGGRSVPAAPSEAPERDQSDEHDDQAAHDAPNEHQDDPDDDDDAAER